MVFIFQPVHSFIKFVQVFVTKERIVEDVPLATGVLERIAISFSRKIEPLIRKTEILARWE